MKSQTIIIMTDSQRWDMVGCYGNADMKTPNIDRLGAEGLRFDRAYTACPLCAPARAALFTGQYPYAAGAFTNDMALFDFTKTVGQRLTDNGIHCAYIGKWHLDGGDYFGMGRCPDGWNSDYWYEMRNYLEELTDDERRKSRDHTIVDREAIQKEFTYAHRCANRAEDFLAKHADEDFLLVVSFDEPHHPWLCPEPYASMYKGYDFPKTPNVHDRLEGKPLHQKTWAGDRVGWNREMLRIDESYFLGCNAYVDYEIGRVLATIDKFAPEALLIYTSDHGEMMESHCLSSKGPAAYDEIARIPFIIRQKGVIASGGNYPYPVSHLDVAPTLMEHMGLPIPKLLNGKSLMPVLRNPSVRINKYVFIEYFRYGTMLDGFGGFQPMRTIFDGRHKLTIHLLSEDELYDLETDPGEINNLIAASGYEQVRNALHDALLENMNETQDPFRGYYWEHRSWRKDVRPLDWEYTRMSRRREHMEYEPMQLDYATGHVAEGSIWAK